MNLENRIYQFRLTTPETIELSMKLAGNSFIASRPSRLLLCFLGGIALLSGFFSFLGGVLVPGAPRFGGSYITAAVSLIFVLFLVQFLYNLRFCQRNGFTKERRYRLSQGYLLDMGASARYHGSTFTAITETPRLLLLKQKLSDTGSLYLVFPKRIFSGLKEQEAFREYLRSAVPVVAPAAHAEPAQFSVSFQLSREDFAHLLTELLRISRNQKPLLKNRAVLARTLLLFLLPSAYGLNMALRGEIAQGCILFGIGGALAAFCIASANEINKDSIVRQMQAGRFPLDESGFWSVTAGPDGLSARHGQNSFSRPWDTYTHYIETVDTLFLIRFERGNLKQYLFIPKWALSGPGEHAALNDLCSAHGKIPQQVKIPEIEDPVRAQTRTKWRLRLIVSLFIVLLFLLIIVSFLSAR